MAVYSMEKRVVGGRGWADCVFRKQAHPRTYSLYVFERLIKRNNLGSSGFKIKEDIQSTQLRLGCFLYVQFDDII